MWCPLRRFLVNDVILFSNKQVISNLLNLKKEGYDMHIIVYADDILITHKEKASAQIIQICKE